MLNIYISVSDNQKRLIIDGSLELFRQFLSSLRQIEDLESPMLSKNLSTKREAINVPQETTTDANA